MLVITIKQGKEKSLLERQPWIYASAVERVDGKPFEKMKSGATALVPGINQVDMGVFQEGDADDSNCVSAQDFIILKNSYAKSPGDPGYDARADFNGDTRVSVVDVNLHKNNMGTSGAPPIRPGNP